MKLKSLWNSDGDFNIVDEDDEGRTVITVAFHTRWAQNLSIYQQAIMSSLVGAELSAVPHPDTPVEEDDEHVLVEP